MYKLFIYILLLFTMNTVYANLETYRLYVDVFPEEANSEIYIWNIKPKFHQGIELSPGRYDLRVKAKGYRTWHKWIHLQNSDIFVQVDLKPQSKRNIDEELPDDEQIFEVIPDDSGVAETGDMPDDVGIVETVSMPEEYILTVETVPDDAIVQFVDQRLRFEQDMLLLPGEYTLLISRNGFVSQERTVQITDKDIALKVVLQPVVSTVSMLSSQVRGKALASPKNLFRLDLKVKPADAIINILTNKLELSYTPNMELPPNTYVIQVKKTGYVTRRELVEITNQDVQKSIELSHPPMCFYGKSEKIEENGKKLYNFYTVRLTFYQNFVEMHYYIQIMPLALTRHYEFRGIQRGDKLELIGLIEHKEKVQEELKIHMLLKNNQLIESINGYRQALQLISCG